MSIGPLQLNRTHALKAVMACVLVVAHFIPAKHAGLIANLLWLLVF